MNPELTPEQKFMLHRIAIETRALSRDELIEELLSCWEGRFAQKQAFLAASKESGFVFKFHEGSAYMPSSEGDEVVEYCLADDDIDDDDLQEVYESANFELDMEEIVLGGED